MGKYLARLGPRLRPVVLWAGLCLIIFGGLYHGLKLLTGFPAAKTGRRQAASSAAINGRKAGFGKDAPRISKYEITLQLKQLSDEIGALEKGGVRSGPLGVRIYAPDTSARLFQRYQAAQMRLAYLNEGMAALSDQTRRWDGYRFVAGRNRPIQVAEIRTALHDLQRYPWAANFLSGIRIFLLPYTIPDVSGLGGAGYNLLSALARSDKTADSATLQTGVTLYHEIGHHLHLSMMPENTAAGRNLWRQYLKLRGTAWHGPGKVKTAAWSESSEETFAEDFRMLFGKDQPFYGDVALGDPRSDPAKAARLRQFMAQLAARPVLSPYQSPWLPDAASVAFWRLQPLLILLLWLTLGAYFGAVYWPHRLPRRLTIPFRPDRKRKKTGAFSA